MNCNKTSDKSASNYETNEAFCLRRTTENDLPAVLAIVASARKLLAADGVPQWQNNKPSDADFLRDVRRGWSRVLVTDSDEIVATAAVVDEPDPNYCELLQGAWISAPTEEPRVLFGPQQHGDTSQCLVASANYVTVHRFAVAPSARGTGAARDLWLLLLEEARARGITEVRVDTHCKNRRMRRLVEGLGFACAGVVCIDKDRSDKRLVYQAFLPQKTQDQHALFTPRDMAESLVARATETLRAGREKTVLPSYPMPFEEHTTPVVRQRVQVPMVDGAELAVWIYGPRVPLDPGPYGIDRGVLPLVVLHGNGEDHTMLAAHIAHAATARSVIALDTRGQGASTRGTTKSLTYELLARDAFEVLSALGVSRAHVLGFSDGGIEALIMACDAPGRIASLTLIGANISPDGLDETFLRQERRRSLALAFGRIASIRLERACELSRLMLHEPHLSPAAFSRIVCPACVIAGEHDVVLPEETNRIAQALPHAEKYIVKGCGHLLPQEAPDAVDKALDETMLRAEKNLRFCDLSAAPKDTSEQASFAVPLCTPVRPYMLSKLVAVPLELRHLSQVLALYDALLAHEKERQNAALELVQSDETHPRASGDSCGWIQGFWPLPGDVEERLRAGQYRGIYEKEALQPDGTLDPSAPLLGVQALDHDMGYGFSGEQASSKQPGAAPLWEPLPEHDVLVPHLLAAHPAAAGKGVGRALVADLMSQARIRGAKAIRLNTSPENVSATMLYQSCGFKMYAPVWLPYEGLPLTGWTVPFEMRLD